MTWGERASERFSAELVGKEKRGRLIFNILDMVTGGTNPDVTPRYELLFKDKQTSEIVLRETYEGDISSGEAIKIAQKDLEELSVPAFCGRYGFPVPD